MNLTLLLSKLGLSMNMSQDVTLLLVVVFVSFIFGMFIGRYKLISVLINIYISLAIINAVPEKYLSEYAYKLIGFLIIVVLLTLLGKKLFEIYISGSGSGFLWRVFAMSFLEVVMLISISLSLVPKKIALEYVSPSSYGYLASENASFLWLVIPLIFMFVIHKRLNR
ncbi:MAG TPA: hypothetical protein P5262_04105 [Candidatus Moranbacteria bacterium]|nr:hypothetical protein [Candidatus Moranbacteria bacterium]